MWQPDILSIIFETSIEFYNFGIIILSESKSAIVSVNHKKKKILLYSRMLHTVFLYCIFMLFGFMYEIV